jgi:hypothetical protein
MSNSPPPKSPGVMSTTSASSVGAKKRAAKRKSVPPISLEDVFNQVSVVTSSNLNPPPGRLTLTPRSAEVCLKLGLNPEILKIRDIDSFWENGLDPAILRIRHEAYVQRRYDTMKQCRLERKRMAVAEFESATNLKTVETLTPEMVLEAQKQENSTLIQLEMLRIEKMQRRQQKELEQMISVSTADADTDSGTHTDTYTYIGTDTGTSADKDIDTYIDTNHILLSSSLLSFPLLHTHTHTVRSEPSQAGTGYGGPHSDRQQERHAEEEAAREAHEDDGRGEAAEGVAEDRYGGGGGAEQTRYSSVFLSYIVYHMLSFYPFIPLYYCLFIIYCLSYIVFYPYILLSFYPFYSTIYLSIYPAVARDMHDREMTLATEAEFKRMEQKRFAREQVHI